MSIQAFDTVTRSAAEGLSRRSSLLTLGATALAATVAKADVGEAKKKKGKDCKKKEKQRCSNDAAACVNTLKATGECDAACLAELTPCCETCSANDFLLCFLTASAP